MGKGDIKSKRGKIANGSSGVSRQKKVKVFTVVPVKTKKAAVKAEKTPEKAEKEKPSTKKTAAAKKPATEKKAPAKKATTKKKEE